MLVTAERVPAPADTHMENPVELVGWSVEPSTASTGRQAAAVRGPALALCVAGAVAHGKENPWALLQGRMEKRTHGLCCRGAWKRVAVAHGKENPCTMLQGQWRMEKRAHALCCRGAWKRVARAHGKENPCALLQGQWCMEKRTHACARVPAVRAFGVGCAKHE